MNEGKDIVGISVPFTAGVSFAALCSVYCTQILENRFIIFWLPGIAFFLCCALIVFSILTRPRKYVFYIVLFLALGCFCYINGNITVSLRKDAGGLAAMAEKSATRVKAVIESIPYTNEETTGVVKALTTGDKSGLGRATTGTFRRSGAAHLLALSGLHLGIIYMLLLWLTAPLGRSPAASRLRSLLLAGLSGYFAIATGRSPSIMRAFYFITINEISKLLCLRQKPLRTLCTALMLQLVISPKIIRSPGFQLSYLAMTGIVTLFPKLESWYPSESKADRFNLPHKLWNITAISVSCQLFTAPVVWYYFHTFPKYFILTNITAIPLTTAVMITSIATIVLTSAGLCPACLVSINETTVQALLWLLQVISEMQ